MNRVRLLSEQVANQIAAGEVVERPASVVKELVENSLDAESGRITVEIQTGGRSLIRVTDDGMGMSRDDALLSLERHATSKIEKAEDLGAISTMGFRGEALPSIASVSRFQIVTRERDDSESDGTRIVINGGKIVEVKAAAAAGGTVVEVRQLFFNLPARRKFLRSEETESAHIQHYLTLAALAFPHVAFTFQKDGRVLWQLPGLSPSPHGRLGALRERLTSFLGAGLELIEVERTISFPSLGEPNRSRDSLTVWGFAGAPGVSRSNRDDQFLFVNRRPVENRGLNYALIEGYHTALMKGRYPVCCLFLEMDAGEVDVNIHPSKREVKFHRERDVREMVAGAVRGALQDFHAIPGLASRVEFIPPVARSAESSGAAPSVEAVPMELAPKVPVRFPAKPVGVGAAPEAWLAGPQTVESHGGGESRIVPVIPVAPSVPSPAGTPLLEVPLRILGVIGKLYVILESDRGLVLLDQHAAHERVLFEQMLRRLEEQGNAMSQRLLLPETVELSARDADFLRQQLATLGRLGIGLSEFGERTFLLDSLPPFVKAPQPKRFVLELVDELRAAGDNVNSLRLGESTVAKTVCRHAVKANDILGMKELEALLRDLRLCTMPYTCPHGRPTLIEMNYRELERKFGRQQ